MQGGMHILIIRTELQNRARQQALVHEEPYVYFIFRCQKNVFFLFSIHQDNIIL
jgi:hypothetical protein